MKIKLIDKKLSSNKQVAYLTFEVQEKFNFKAGQFVILDNGKLKRAYSIASSPYLLQEKMISFYVKKASENGMSAYLVDKIKVQDMLDMIGPFGNMFLKDYSKENIYLFISAGSGLGPILGIYEDLIYKGIYNKIYNFYQERYFENIVEDVYKKMISFEKDNVKNYFFLSKQEHPGFETGYIEGKVLEVLKNIKDKKNIKAYICGKPSFVEELENLLKENQVENIYFEKY